MEGRRGLIRPYDAQLTILQRLFDAFWIAWTYFLVNRAFGESWELHDTAAISAAVLTFEFVGEIGSLYRPWRAAARTSEIGRVFLVWSIVATILLFLAFATKLSDIFSRAVTFTWYLVAPVAISTWRMVVRLVLRELRKRGFNTRHAAIVGATEMGSALAQSILLTPWSGLRITGYYDDRSADRRHPMPALLGEARGSIEKLLDDVRRGGIDHVYIALPLRAEPRINDLVRKLADSTASVHVVANFFVFDLLHARWSNAYGIPIVSVYETPFFGVNGWLKRLEDLILGTLILAIIALPMLIIAIGVKMSSKGPVFFRQRRYGLNGEEIRVLKFRTMTCCEDGATIKQATRDDARITRFGAFLRRTSLDELPQFFHVITGEMSIVGPRPHAVAHNEQYRRLIHGYMLRHKVRPGITGWAQVNGWRGETDTLDKMQKRVEHDLHYIENWNLGLDLKIIVMTVFGAAVRRNAY